MIDAHEDLQILKLYYCQGSFRRCYEVAQSYLKTDLFERDLKQYFYILRLGFQSARELDCFHELEAEIYKIQQVSDASAEYILGMWELAHQRVLPGKNYFIKALQKAIDEQDHELVCRATHALAVTDVWCQDWVSAQSRIEKALSICRVLKLEEIEASTLLLKASILSANQKLDEALFALWNAYEIARKGFYFNLQANILIHLGVAYQNSGQELLSQHYAKLALNGLDSQQFPRLFKAAQNLLSKASLKPSGPDLLLDRESLKVKIQNTKFVCFGQQHILFDLLVLFTTHPGVRFSKEEIIRKIWGQDYDPRQHDNLIYVSVKRLRDLIEPTEGSPIFILRDRKGYFLSRNITVGEACQLEAQ